MSQRLIKISIITLTIWIVLSFIFSWFNSRLLNSKILGWAFENGIKTGIIKIAILLFVGHVIYKEIVS